MGQLQDAQKDAEVTSEATERELELEAQLVEARSIIQEQVLFVSFYANRRLDVMHSSLDYYLDLMNFLFIRSLLIIMQFFF